MKKIEKEKEEKEASDDSDPNSICVSDCIQPWIGALSLPVIGVMRPAFVVSFLCLGSIHDIRMQLFFNGRSAQIQSLDMQAMWMKYVFETVKQ